jgi:sugar phosphate isomerase/epimerase
MIVSVPSYVIPGSYAENIEFLAPRIEIRAVELLFFSYDRESRELFLSERKLISSYRDRFRFSVHLPELLLPEHEELIELTRDLADRYIVHPPAADAGSFPALMNRWRERYGERFLLENLAETDAWPAAEVLAGMPLCCDTGHLLLSRADVGQFLRRYGARVREIHLHGVRGGRDHRRFGAGEPWFRAVASYLRDFSGVVNLEVFSIGEVNAILGVLQKSGLL